MPDSLTIGITCGDLHGIGLEVALKAIAMRQDGIHYRIYAPQGVIDPKDIPDMVNVRIEELGVLENELRPGMPTHESSLWAIKSLERTVDDLLGGRIDAMVTAPIDKHAMSKAGFEHPGHTEYLAERAGGADHLMLLVSGALRVGTVTGHIPISGVAHRLSKESILAKLRVMHRSLTSDFGIPGPRIAVLGLNPHAGDKGRIGDEESTIIRPAIEQGRSEGLDLSDPQPADGFFGSKAYEGFDGILSMFHDQGLIPFKLLSFGKGVNFTAGLPFVRTSPDHGTAFGIAGQGIADPGSFASAIDAAIAIAHNRRQRPN